MTRESPNAAAEKSAFPRVAADPHRAPSLAPNSLVEECLQRTAAEMAHARVRVLAGAVTDPGESRGRDTTSRSAVRLAVPALAELTILVQPSAIDGEWSIVQALDVGDGVVLDEFTGADRLPAHLSEAIDRALAHGTQELLFADSLLSSRTPEVIAIPLRGRGRTFGVLTFSHGPTGRKFSHADQTTAEAFAALTASAIDNARHDQELEEVDRRKTESMSVLAHELRNPLGAIRHAVALLRRCGTDEAAINLAQNVIDNQVTHMVRLVDDLSDVSRLANGKVQLKLALLDLTTVVRDAAEGSRPFIEARQHCLTVRAPEEPLTVHADGVRLAQVLGNLLTNAAKYTPPGGAISLSAEREGDEAVLRVTDNGVGIPADKLPQVFDMFMQVDSSLDLSQGGLGIGLMLVRRFVEMHGGSVQAAARTVEASLPSVCRWRAIRSFNLS